MTSGEHGLRETPSRSVGEFDAVVIGAGMSGLYMLHRLRDTLGLSARVLETADDVGPVCDRLEAMVSGRAP